MIGSVGATSESPRRTLDVAPSVFAHSGFLCLYTMVILVIFSPLKPVAYFLPLLFIGGSILTGAIRTRSILRILGVVGAAMVLAFVHSLLNSEFLWGNFVLSLITFSSLLVLLCDFSSVATRSLLRKLVLITLVVIFLQAMWGIIQGVTTAIVERGWRFDGDVGDAVKGTISPRLGPDGTGSNPMFAILMSGFLVLLYPSRTFFLHKWQVFMLIPVAISWILASVMHTFFFLAGALLVSVLIARPVWSALGQRSKPVVMRSSVRVLFTVIVLLAIFFLLLMLVFPDNFGLLKHLFEQTFSLDSGNMTPKALATVNTLVHLPEGHSYQPWVGVGLGQYSSRAGLIMSGTYLGRDFLFATQYADFSYEFIYQMQERLRDYEPDAGSTKFPYYSWLTVYGELGAVGIGMLLLIAIRVSRRITKVVKDIPRTAPLLAPVLLGMFYVLLLGFQDNYWEFAQAIFPLLLFMRLFYDLGMYEWRQQGSALKKPI